MYRSECRIWPVSEMPTFELSWTPPYRGSLHGGALPAAYPIYAPVLRYHGPALNSVLDKTIAGVAVVVDAVLLLQFLDVA